jgi:predicted Zn-dependent protease
LKEWAFCAKLDGMKLKYLLGTTAIVGLAGLAGCALTSYNVATSQQETSFISTETEIALGESLAKRVEEEFHPVRDPDLLQQLDRVASRVASVADRKDLSYRFTIVEMPDDQPNAFALPGGPIYVTRSLFQLIKSDDELAAVLAHEVGHVVARHSIKRLQAAVGLNFLQLIAMGAHGLDAQTRQGVDLAFGALLLEYSQADELEADKLSVKYLKAAGFDPHAAITFMERLRNHTFKQPMRRFSYFRTHPFFGDRIRVLRQEAEGQMTFDDYINIRPN